MFTGGLAADDGSAGKEKFSAGQAFAQGLIGTGDGAQLVLGGGSKGRPDPAGTAVRSCRVGEVQPQRSVVELIVDGPLPASRRVHVAFGAPEGLLLAYASVMRAKVLPDGNSILVRLVSMRCIEDRRERRVPVTGVRITFWSGDRWGDCPVTDLSPIGMRILPSLPPETGDELKIRLHVPIADTIGIEGRVVWVRESPDGEASAGIELTDLTPILQSKLAVICMLYEKLVVINKDDVKE